MQIQPKFTRAMLGYALWVAIEDTLRNWLARRLIELFGSEWDQQFPGGIWNRLHEKYNESIDLSNFSQIRELLEYSDFPDLLVIVKFRKQLNSFLPDISIEDVDYYNQKLYGIRNQIAHKPYSFTVRSLDDLVGCAEWVIGVVGPLGSDLQKIKDGIEKNPELYAQLIPDEFVLNVKTSNHYKITNNLPPMDYEYDGGFVGRRDERKDLKQKLINKKIFPIVTVAGAGGVGKTALAHHICEELLTNHPDTFDGIIWISAKKDRLTVTGIEEIEPTATTFSGVLDAILSTFGFDDYLSKSTNEKSSVVKEIVLDSAEHGILLVVDNLETLLHDIELLDFLKEMPLPNKVLITSRLGLGEIEKRIPLKEMSPGDAIELFRRIAIEKSVKKLAQLPSETISTYVNKMSKYPLVIKWVIGQAAVNKDIDRLVQTINSTESDISKFCFEYIFKHLLSNNAKKVLLCLASSEDDLTQAALMDVVDLNIQEFEDVMLELELASLIIPDQQKDPNEDKIITKYGVLPLTKAYLTSQGEARHDIKGKLQSIQKLIQDSQQARKQYELSLEYFGGETEAELIASKSIATAFTRNQAGDYLGSMDALKRAEEIAPEFAAIYRSRAVIESNNENYNAAIEMFEKSVKLKPNDPITWYHWGNLEKDLANYDKARECLKMALQLVDHKPTVLIAIGNMETRASNFNQAIQFFEEAIKELSNLEKSKYTRELIIADTALANAHYLWAEMFEHNGQFIEALEQAHIGYDTILSTSQYGQSDTKTLETETKCLVILGKLYKHQKQFVKAKDYLEQVVFTEMPQRYWSLKQRRYYLRACYQLVLTLLEDKTSDLTSIKEIFMKGLGLISVDSEFATRYQNLALLFDGERYEGKFIRIVEGKGYGFIECPEADPNNIFGHISQFIDEISDISIMRNIWVSFSLHRDQKGTSAKAIRVLHKQ